MTTNAQGPVLVRFHVPWWRTVVLAVYGNRECPQCLYARALAFAAEFTARSAAREKERLARWRARKELDAPDYPPDELAHRRRRRRR